MEASLSQLRPYKEAFRSTVTGILDPPRQTGEEEGNRDSPSSRYQRDINLELCSALTEQAAANLQNDVH